MSYENEAGTEVANKKHLEFMRMQSKQRFDKIRPTMLECLRWAAPHRAKWMQSQEPGERNNFHIVDPTHILALRSFVAGFMEGNTSSTRPWYRIGTGDPDINHYSKNRDWLDIFARRTLSVLASSNFYHAAGQFYYDYGAGHTGAHYIEERKGGLFFHTLTPGSYYVLNNGYGEAVVMVREFQLSVKALVETYGRKKNGKWDYSNFTSGVAKAYQDCNYTQQIDVVHVMYENPKFDPNQPEALLNRRWLSVTYEAGGMIGEYTVDGQGAGSSTGSFDDKDKDKFLEIKSSKRKPFIVGKTESSSNFEYGETGPTLMALGLIKSLNKKAISKDQALEMAIRPPLQGPANLKKTYVTSAPNSFVPLDASSLAQKGLRTIYEINPAIANLVEDVADLRTIVDKIYYADYLLYLSRNPKTRTAREVDAIVQEQQLIIGPNLQSLNWTYNVPVIEFVMDYVLWEDPLLPPPPEELSGQFLRPEIISPFQQAQKAADLPAIDRYVAMVTQVGSIDPRIFDKANLDKLADLYEDRLFLPAGLNNPQAKVDAMRQQQAAQQQQQKMLTETLPAMAGAAKDVGLKLDQ